MYISVVGVDRVRWGYMKTKLDCERLVQSSGRPWTILRATRFFPLLIAGAKVLGRLPLVPVPAGFTVQPIDPGKVGKR